MHLILKGLDYRQCKGETLSNHLPRAAQIPCGRWELGTLATWLQSPRAGCHSVRPHVSTLSHTPSCVYQQKGLCLQQPRLPQLSSPGPSVFPPTPGSPDSLLYLPSSHRPIRGVCANSPAIFMAPEKGKIRKPGQDKNKNKKTNSCQMALAGPRPLGEIVALNAHGSCWHREETPGYISWTNGRILTDAIYR